MDIATNAASGTGDATDTVLAALADTLGDEGTGSTPARVQLPRLLPVIDALPCLLARVAAGLPDGDMRRPVVAALAALDLADDRLDELWLRGCAAVGLFSDSVRAAEPAADISAALAELRDLADRDAVAALAGLAALVSWLPSTASTIVAELCADPTAGPGVQALEQVSFRVGPLRRPLRDAVEHALRSQPASAPAALAATHGAARMASPRFTR